MNSLKFYMILFIFFSIQSKNILFVVPQFPKVSDVHMLNQMTALVDGGHDVSIFARKRGVRGPVQKDVFNYNLLENIFYEKFPQDINQFDIIIFQLGHLTFDVKKKLGFTGKVLVCIRGYDITGHVKEEPQFYRSLFDCIDIFLPVCDYFREKLLQLGCPKEKIIVLYSAIDTEKFVFKNKKIKNKKTVKCISACRFVEKKGIHTFLKALYVVVKKHPHIQYMLVGDGKYRRLYRRLIRKHRLKNHVTIMGWSTHKKLKKLLCASDFCIVPSQTAENGDKEGIPNVAKEAMAVGIPVISTYHAGIPELIIDEVTGFLVLENNYKALSKKLLELLASDRDFSLVTKKARMIIEKKFSKKVLSKKLCKIVADCC